MIRQPYTTSQTTTAAFWFLSRGYPIWILGRVMAILPEDFLGSQLNPSRKGKQHELNGKIIIT